MPSAPSHGSGSDPGLRPRLLLTEASFVATCVVVGFGVGTIAVVTGALPGPGEKSWVQPLGGPIVMAAMGLAYVGLQRRGAPQLRAPLPTARPTVRGALVWVVALTALLVAGSALLAFVLEWVGVPIQEQERVSAITGHGWVFTPELITLVFAAIVLAPLSEEWVFRGLLFRRLWLAGGPYLAYSVNALLFAASHDNIAGFLTYVWLATVFAWGYRLTGRLWCAMVIHLLNNAITLVLLLDAGSRAAGT